MKVVLIDPIGGKGGMDYYNQGLGIGLSNHAKIYHCTNLKTINRFPEKINQYNLFDSSLWNINNPIIQFIKLLQGHINSLKLIKREDIDIIHLHSFGFYLYDPIIYILYSLSRRKIAVTIHDVQKFKQSKNFKFIDKICLSLTKVIIVHNHETAKNLFKYLGITRVSVIPHGNYTPFIKKKKDIDLDQHIKLLFIGQIKKVKGVEILLKAYEIAKMKRKELELTIVGKISDYSNEETREIENICIRMGVKYVFKFLSDDEMEEYLNESSIVILPYKKIYQSGIILHAISYARPVICSDIPPFKNFIEKYRCGKLFVSEDYINLSEVLINISKAEIKRFENSIHNQILKESDWYKIGFLTYEKYLNEC